MGYSVLNFPFNIDLNHFWDITFPFFSIRMQHHVLDLSELHSMKLNLIPVSNLVYLRQRRSSITWLLLFLLGRILLNDRDSGDLINDRNWDDRGRWLLALLVLIMYQINDLFQIVFKCRLISWNTGENFFLFSKHLNYRIQLALDYFRLRFNSLLKGFFGIPNG